MVNTPDWVSVSLQLGNSKPGTVDATQAVPFGTTAVFRDNGSTQLGVGTFIYLPGVASTTEGDFVAITPSDGSGSSTNKGWATTRWDGTANTGKPLAVATAAVTAATSFGWYQLQGSAICNISGTVTIGNPAYFAATAAVKATPAVGGKQVLGVVAGSANGVPDTTNAIYYLSYPFVQGQIT